MSLTARVRHRGRIWAAMAGASAMVMVGGSTAVSGLLTTAPLASAQAVRYALAALLLWAAGRMSGRRLHRPRHGEWLWLSGVAASGLVVFNIALVRGARHAEPAVFGVAVACVPLALAGLGPLLGGQRPGRRLLLAAVLVTGGAILVQGLGRSDGRGLLWALTVMAGEVGFTLLAVPLLARHGPWGISTHTTWIAALMFGGVGVATEGPTAPARLNTGQVLAVGYLALAVTALAFLLWYHCVNRLGAGRAGLLTGVAPVSASTAGVALGGAPPGVAVCAGIAVVILGLAVGLGSPTDLPRRDARPVPDREPSRPRPAGAPLAAPPGHLGGSVAVPGR